MMTVKIPDDKHFQRAIENLLAGIRHTVVYWDDISVTDVTEKGHKANVKEVLRQLAGACLHLKKEKCNFGVEAVEYLGHRSTKDGLATLESRVRAPSNVTPVKSFQGMLTFYLRFEILFGYDPLTSSPTTEERPGLPLGSNQQRSFCGKPQF